jgi:hypothetical protein
LSLKIKQFKYSKTSISEHLLYERVCRSPRWIFAVNELLYSEHLPTMNSERSFWSLRQRKPLYSEHMCSKYAYVYETKEKREHNIHSEVPLGLFIDHIFITSKFVVCVKEKEQWKWIVRDELIGRMWKNNTLFYLRLYDDDETHVDPLKRYS